LDEGTGTNDGGNLVQVFGLSQEMQNWIVLPEYKALVA
jgi:hypothetical protein